MWTFWRISLIGIALVTLDQIIKGSIQYFFIKGQIFKLTNSISIIYFQSLETQNIWLHYFFLIFFPLFCLFMLYRIWLHRKKNNLLCLSYGLMLSGCFGLWIDYILFQSFLRFLKINIINNHWPILNLSDLMFLCGGSIWAICYGKSFLKRKSSTLP